MRKLQRILVGCLMFALLAATAEGQRRPRKPQPPISRWGKVLIAEGTVQNKIRSGVGPAIGALKPDGLNRLYVPSFNGNLTEFEYNGETGQWTNAVVVSGDYEILAIGNLRNPSAQRIYAVEGVGSNVFEISFESGAWVKRTVGTVTNGSFRPVIGPGRDDGINRLYVPAGDGNTYEFTYSEPNQRWEQTSTITGFTGVSIGVGLNDTHYRLYGSDGDHAETRHLYQYSYDGGWQRVDMGPWQSNDVYQFIGREYMATVAQGQNDNLNRIYTQTTDNRFYEYSYEGGSWITRVLNPTEPIPQYYGPLFFGHIVLDNSDLKGYCAGQTDPTEDSVGVYEFRYNPVTESWTKDKIGTAGMGIASLIIGDARNDGGLRIYTCSQAGIWYGIPKVTSTSALYEFYIAW